LLLLGLIGQLKTTPDAYSNYVPMKYIDYLKNMAKNGEWGDHVTLQAAADYYGVKISLITSFKDTCFIEIVPTEQKSKRAFLFGGPIDVAPTSFSDSLSWKYLQKCISASGQRSTTTQFTLQVVSHTACTVHYILYSTSLCCDLFRALHHCHVAETSPGVTDFTMALEATPLESLEVQTASLNERFSSELFFSYSIIDQGRLH
jgi:hypothetical protein